VSIRSLLLAVFICAIAFPSGAAVKAYDASKDNGTPGDNRQISINTCPPIRFVPDVMTGNYTLNDDGLGTVTLDRLVSAEDRQVDIGPNTLAPNFGPGAFVFIAANVSRVVNLDNVSDVDGIGAHGPSGTDPGESTEWGVVSGWFPSGTLFCIASPTAICTLNQFTHGSTAVFTLESTTYNLGTWNFDAQGDMSAETWYFKRTSNGGLANTQSYLTGAFHGSSLPALPLVGFGVLAACLAVAGGRSLIGKK